MKITKAKHNFLIHTGIPDNYMYAFFVMQEMIKLVVSKMDK